MSRPSNEAKERKQTGLWYLDGEIYMNLRLQVSGMLNFPQKPELARPAKFAIADALKEGMDYETFCPTEEQWRKGWVLLVRSTLEALAEAVKEERRDRILEQYRLLQRTAERFDFVALRGNHMVNVLKRDIAACFEKSGSE